MISDEIKAAASTLLANIKADIKNATTRLEHVRTTALAQEAENLVTLIESQETETGVPDQTNN